MAAFPEYFPNDDSLDLYIRDLADRVGLRDWKIMLEDKAPDDGNLGECFCAYGQRVATIRLAEHETIEKLQHTIVHELKMGSRMSLPRCSPIQNIVSRGGPQSRSFYFTPRF